MRPGFSDPFVVLITFLIAVAGARVHAQTETEPCIAHVLPANLKMPSDMERIVSRYYDRSSTLRAQCARMGEAGNLVVSVRLDVTIPSSCRAFTVLERRGGRLRALVHVPPSGDQMAELLGHEFEHILEQLEGLDLRLLSDVHGSGVHRVQTEMFETERAQRAGRIVAGEVR